MTRLICDIHDDIKRDWRKVNYAAVPYLQAMRYLGSINDNYGLDPGYEIISRFLCNASTWRGPVARKIKVELNQMLKGK